MLSLLDSISNSAYFTWQRDSITIFGYATVLALHTFGLILVVGISAAIALRTVGVASDIPLAPLRSYVPIMWAGFYLNFVTGLLLFFQDGRNFATNPDYWIKMVGVAAAVIMMMRLLAYLRGPAVVDTRPVPSEGRKLAYGVLLSWAVAVTAGRLTAYDFLVEWQSAIAVTIALVVIALFVVYIAPSLFSLGQSGREHAVRSDRVSGTTR